MKKHYYSYPQKTKSSFPFSVILILFLCIVLLLLLGNILKKYQASNFALSETPSLPSATSSSDNDTGSSYTPSSKELPTIIIDAGHGGKDPGKVSESGTLEKDINLEIALLLKELLETQEMNIIMTRQEDKELSTDMSNRKLSDIRQRVKIMEDSNADIVISIHQNSYTDPQVYGAQCFYPSNSEESKQLASMIQEQIVTATNQTKIREIKANDSYYLLKESPIPIVIVECGFLSNPQEEALLLSNDYQRQLAWGIQLGILNYINKD